MKKTVVRVLLFFIGIFTGAGAWAQWAPASLYAPSAWEKGVYGDGVTIAILGAGVDRTHPRLRNALALNPGEVGLDPYGFDKRYNNYDDDGNGFKDDWSGWDFVASSGNTVPRRKLGTQIAGVIASQHRDTKAKSGTLQGIAPGALILPVRFIDDNGFANVASLIGAIDYAVVRKAKIIVAPWTLESDIPVLREKVLDLAGKGILFVSAAGQDARNIDLRPKFPASYNFSHQVTVGAHGSRDFKMAGFTNFGRNSVHLMAPGLQIASTVPGGGVEKVNGGETALATGYVAATAALLWQYRPEASVLEVIDALMSGTTYESTYEGLCWTEGRLNVRAALAEMTAIIPY